MIISRHDIEARGHVTTSRHESEAHLFQEVDGGLEVEAEVDEGPLDALALVLGLLQDEHGVVEELLQLLVRVVDAQLFEGVHLKHTNGHDVVSSETDSWGWGHNNDYKIQGPNSLSPVFERKACTFVESQ